MTFLKSYLGLAALLSLLVIPLLMEPTITGMAVLSQEIPASIFITFILFGVIGLLITELVVTRPAPPPARTRTLEHIDEDIARISRRINR